MPKSVLMCRPDYFDIEYEINPWMHTTNHVNQPLAKQQWQQIYDIYTQLGYQIELISPQNGLPDMVFTANGGLVIDGRVMLPRFKHPERQPETAHFQTWFQQADYTDIQMPANDFEGEGDALVANNIIYAGHGFRSDIDSHAELSRYFNRQVISLRLVDPHFYHLDTCFCPLSSQAVMFCPTAFDANSQRLIRSHFQTVIEANPREAAAFGLNAVSDGRNVILSNRAPQLAAQLIDRGFNPITTPITEFHKSGGGVKCLTLELRQ